MSKAKRDHQLVLETHDFLAAIKTVKPHRVDAAAKLSECQLGYVAGEAIFCLNGAQTRRPAVGSWPGFARFRFALMLAVLKVPPPEPLIEIRCSDAAVQIGATRVPARWIESSEWIAEMALEAHLHGPDKAPAPQELYCPKCGRREGVFLRDLLRPASTGRHPAPQERIHIGGRTLDAEPTRACKSCRNQWIELDD